MTVLIALTSGLMWGAADFFGGTASRRLPALLVVLLTQAAGFVVAVVAATASRAFGAHPGYLPWAIGAGAVGALGLVLFYRALAAGTMGVVSPIAALGVVVPVIVALVGGTLPSPVVLTGMAVALAGVVALSGPERSSAAGSRTVLLAIASAVCFGLALTGISRGAHYSATMTVVGMRATSVPLLGIVAVFGPRLTFSERIGGGLWGLLVLIGVLDVGANLMFGLASAHGQLAIVAVLGSLYPAATVLLARFIDQERLRPTQRIGAVAALLGVALIAGGS